MSQTQSIQPFPRGALLGAAALVGITIVSAGTARLVGLKQPHPVAAVLAARDLRFEDKADGSIVVVDAGSGQTVDTLPPGSNGFIRASLRSLAKRRQFDGNMSQVFHITAWSDGRLTLDDPSTGNPIELEAFGETNEAAFAKLLHVGSQSR
ncbi:photosynthetic complex assembly protein PuhC [Lichenifustis flavocetrariae]|uniref:Photosynthetic complex assembly protein PuhC n=1 Tax=Lichenifustis flavocetrariae TaxID=2949735 RepID=A0AA42CLH3_9HYPH|nr:photosynthetic complex assembly protein PuhC [Lichenifustis flavocetrariae]MCW6507310.1 photosynthetic complex assembly protein PuhC [Lichenifustis flavocetrariae]